LRLYLRNKEENVGDTCQIPVNATLSLLESKWRYIPLKNALAVYDDRVLDGCKTSNDGKMILFRDIRRAPKKTIGRVPNPAQGTPIAYASTSARDEIDDYYDIFTKFGLSKRWRIQSRKDCMYDIIRHLIKLEINANDVPDTWNNSTIAHDCLWTITRGVDEDDEEAHMDAVYEQMRVLGTYSITNLEATRTMIEHMVEKKRILVHVGANIHVMGTDLEHCTEIINMRISKPPYFENCSDVNFVTQPSMDDITRICNNISEAQDRYLKDLAIFDKHSHHVDTFVRNNIRDETMQSVMNHARNFNNLLIEVEAYGYTVDETIVSLATTIYTSLEVGDMLNTAITVLWLHSVIPDLRKCQLPLNTVDCLITVISRMWYGRFPRLTPPSVMSRVIDGVNTHVVRARKNKSTKDSDTLKVGDVLSRVQHMIIERNCNHEVVVQLRRLRNRLVDVIELTQREWLVDHSMYIHFHKLKSWDTTNKKTYNIEDAPSDIKSLWLL
jgi:hypothetical protein